MISCFRLSVWDCPKSLLILSLVRPRHARESWLNHIKTEGEALWHVHRQMPVQPGNKYYLQNVYTGHFLYGTEGRTTLNTSSVKYDNSFYHWEFAPWLHKPHYWIRNVGTSNNLSISTFDSFYGRWNVASSQNGKIADSVWSVEESSTGLGKLGKHTPSNGMEYHLYEDVGNLFTVPPGYIHGGHEPTRTIWRWISLSALVPSSITPSSSIPLPKTIQSRTPPPLDLVPDPPKEDPPDPPPIPRKQTKAQDDATTPIPPPPPPQERENISLIPPSLVDLDITGLVTTSVPEPFKGLYFDIYRGVLRASVKPSGPKFQHVVAIKALRPGFDARSTSEEQAAFEVLLNSFIDQWSKLENDHLVPLLGIDMAYGPFPALVTSWMMNGLLTEYLSSKHRSDAEKMKLIIGVGKGITYLHSKDIVHSDIQASSVLIDELGNPRLNDPGLLDVLEKSPLLANGKPSSSYRWTAPELLLDPEAKTTKASDIFAFSMTSLEIWTEKHPYDGVVDSLVPGLILQAQPPNRPGSVSDPLWSLWIKGWDKDSVNRLDMSEHVGRLEAL